MDTRRDTRRLSSSMSKPVSQLVSPRAIAMLSGKRVLVTGACGTVGRQLVQQLLANFEIASLTALDHNESSLMFLEERYSAHVNTRFVLSDIRDLGSLLRETRNVDILFHAAAYKHVYLCERSPLEAIQTNILGVQNVIHAAVENGVDRLVFASFRQGGQSNECDGHVEANGRAIDHRRCAPSRSTECTFSLNSFWQRPRLARIGHSDFS